MSHHVAPGASLAHTLNDIGRQYVRSSNTMPEGSYPTPSGLPRQDVSSRSTDPAFVVPPWPANDAALSFVDILHAHLTRHISSKTQSSPYQNSVLDMPVFAEGLAHSVMPLLRRLAIRAVVYADGLNPRLATCTGFPELDRVLATICGNVAFAAVEILSRVETDSGDIARQFNACGRIASIRMRLGDLHNNGRSVSAVTFENNVTLIYKPRRLSPDKNFASFAAALAPEYSFPVPSVMTRTTHGWASRIASDPAMLERDIPNYFRNAGGLLAILYILGATDMHESNVSVVDGLPTPTDFETLLDPLIPESGSVEADIRAVGMLPGSIVSSGDGQSVDFSALTGGSDPRTSPGEALVVERSEGGSPKLVGKRRSLPFPTSVPHLRGTPASGAHFATDISEGFADVYTRAMRGRRQLKEGSASVRMFANDPVRVVLRDTSVYARILDESMCPTLLSDSAARAQVVYSALSNCKGTSPEAIDSEFTQIMRGDVPYFVTDASSTTLRDLNGPLNLGYFRRSGIELALGRIDSLNEENLVASTDSIQASLKLSSPVD